MTEYTAFRIAKPTLEELRIVAGVKERSMAGQVRFMVKRELMDLRENGLIEDQVTEGKEPVGG